MGKEKQRLEEAYNHNEFVLYYQPQFDLISGTFEGVEALIRWHHPVKGMLLPTEFLLLAEETGLILPIGDWVLQTACKQNKAWQNSGIVPMRVAVNLSHRQLAERDIVERVKQALYSSSLEAKYLELEITESVAIDKEEIITKVHDLKKLGVIITLDDFGTGYSSLSHLKRLPLDRVKIDRNFVKNIHAPNKKDEVIIRGIIDIATGLNLQVIAEGVETNHQLQFLKEFSCTEAQGFYFCEPLSAEDVIRFYEKCKSNGKFS